MAEIDPDIQQLFDGQEGEAKAQTTANIEQTGAIDPDIAALFGGEAEASLPAPEKEVSIGDTLERGTRTLAGNLVTFLGEPVRGKKILQGGPQATYQSFTEVEDLGDVGGFIGERTLESLPSTGLSLLGGIAGGFITGGPIGAVVGAMLATAPNLIGEAQQEVIEGGGEGTLAEGLPAGAANTALEMFPVTKVAKALGLNKVFKDTAKEVLEESPEAVETLMSEVLRRTKDVGEIALTEGAVETLQTLNNKFNERFMNNKEVLALSEEDRAELLESFVGGAAGGTGMGAAANVGGAVLDRTLLKDIDLPGVEVPGKGGGEREHEVRVRIREILKDLDKADNDIDDMAARYEEDGDTPHIFQGLNGSTAGEFGAIPPGRTRRGPNSGSIFGYHLGSLADNRIWNAIQGMQVFGGRDAEGNPITALRGVVDTSKEEGNVATAVFDDITLLKTRAETGGDADGLAISEPISGVEMSETVQNMVSSVLQQLGITDLHLTIMDQNAASTYGQPLGNALGHFYRGEQTGSVIGLDMKKLEENARNRTEFETSLFDVLSHELGHAIINHEWQKIGGGVGNPKKGRIYKALIQGYREWLRDIDQLTYDQYQRKYETFGDWDRRTRGYKTTKGKPVREVMRLFFGETDAGANHLAYQLSFDEYAAQMMAKWMNGKLGDMQLDPEVQTWFSRMMERLQKYHRFIKKHFAPEQTFKAWLDAHTLRQELKEARERAEQLGVPHEDLKSTQELVEGEVEVEVEDTETTGEKSPLQKYEERKKWIEDNGYQIDFEMRDDGTRAHLIRDSEGEIVGSVVAQDEGNGTWNVTGSELDPSLRGQGLGTFLYVGLVESLRTDNQNVALASDSWVSHDAMNVWNALGMQGYTLSKHPAIRTATGGFESTDGQPIYILDLQASGPLDFRAAPEGSFLGGVLGRMGLREVEEQMDEHNSVIMGFMRVAKLLTPIQISDLARKYGIDMPRRYMDLVREFANTKMKQIEIADQIAQKWRKLGKTRSTKLGNFLFAVSDKSDEEGRRLTNEELQELRTSLGLDDETFEMWREIDASFREVLDNIERGLVLDAAQSFISDPERARAFRDVYMALSDDASRLELIEDFTGLPAIPDLTAPGAIEANPLKTELDRIQKSVEKLKNRNYFPRTRLGQYTVVIKAQMEGQEWEGRVADKAGETLGFYAFDTKKERDAAIKALKADARREGLSIVGSKMDSEVFAMMGMPEALIQRIMNDEGVKLTPEQREQLKDISLNLSPGKKFLKHLKKRRGIAGFSEDGLRVYVNYMMSAANHLARVEHSKSMLGVLQEMDNAIRDRLKDGTGEIIDDLVNVKDYFRRHFDYLMKPDNDWAQLRAVGFLWYLGFNVKSALVNLTQIPLVTYPVMAGKFGDERSLKHITKAYSSVTNWIRGKEGALTPEEEALLQHFREAGIIDESMVMELAGLGEGDVLKRTIPGWDFDNMLSKVSYWGGAMFRMGEKYNRLVTAVAAYRAGRESGMTDEQARKVARETIEQSQFEYAKWNRPEFMRGKKSVIFLFWQYMQHASFLFAGGGGKKTAIRMWLLALLIAGVEGLPFWKTLEAILDFGGTQMKKALGSSNPRVDLGGDLRELLLEITDKPDLILRGMSSQWGLGPAHLTSLLGAPIPNVDIQGSLGFGSPVQFLDEAFQGSGNPDEELGKLAAAILGPVGGMAIQAYRQMASTDPNTWKRVEKSMPVFMKNAMQGGRWLVEGEETFRGEGEFLNMERPEDRVASVMKMLGFTPTRLSQKYLQVKAQQEVTLYWTLRRQLLLEDYAYARAIGDREAQADARRAIKDHNKVVSANKKLRGMGINGGDLSKSLRSRIKSVKMRERGVPESKRERALARDVQRLFPVEE